ncbi:MAG: PEP-CTERM sorting domain-containing protein [Spirulina sp. DLM2.Bin59]|nr:MAG: PEP-CTERM sorting domain-containing protein [Spirulina sp. DLM2.Bin59]
MKRFTFVLSSVLAGFAIAATAGVAEAFTFKTNYSLDANLSGDDQWRGNILLDSVKYNDEVHNDFRFVNRVDILHNDLWTGGNTGAASADMGRHATIGLSQEKLTNAGAVGALGNNNLSSIIDGEDRGAFSMNIFFEQAVQNILVWERGMNSGMDIQAIDVNGNAIGNLLHIARNNGWSDAGFRMGTMEIGNNVQNVGSRGVTWTDLGLSNAAIAGVRVSAQGNATYNGPDWKIVGVETATTPEPFSIIGGAIALGGAALMKRRAAK